MNSIFPSYGLHLRSTSSGTVNMMMDLGITSRAGFKSELIAFADSNYSMTKDRRRSVSEGVVIYGGEDVTSLSRT